MMIAYTPEGNQVLCNNMADADAAATKLAGIYGTASIVDINTMSIRDRAWGLWRRIAAGSPLAAKVDAMVAEIAS